MSEIWHSSSTFNRAFIWYPWCWNRSIFEKKLLSRIYIEVVYTYDANDATDQKHGFLKFWTLNSKNGLKWTLGTPWDKSPKKIPAFFHYSNDIGKSMKFSRFQYIFSLEILKLKPSTSMKILSTINNFTRNKLPST